jgi:Ca2+-binding EF-hand superfamily protein
MIRKGYETPREKLETSAGDEEGSGDSDSPLGRQYGDSARETMAQWAEREKEELHQSPDPPQWPSGQLLGEGALSPSGSARSSPRGSHGSPGSSGGRGRSSPRVSSSPRRPRRPQLDHVTKQERDEIFQRMDVNGNGALSLAEIDKAVVELWPKLNHKKPMMRAYMAADISGDRLIGRREFRLLLKNLVFFNNLWAKFEEIDKNHDKRLDLDEFKDAGKMLEITVASWRAQEDFDRIDEEGSGYVTFDEFCRWCAERHLLGCKSDSDSESDDEYTARRRISTPRDAAADRSNRSSRGRYSSSESDSDEETARYRDRRTSSGRKARDGRRSSDGGRPLPSYERPVPRSEHQTDAYLEKVLKQMETDAAVQIQALHRGESTRKDLRANGRLPSQQRQRSKPEQGQQDDDGQQQQPECQEQPKTSARTTISGVNATSTVVPPPVPAEARGQQPAAVAVARAVVVTSASPHRSVDNHGKRASTGNQLEDLQRELQEALQTQAEQRGVIDKLTALLGDQRSKAAVERQRHKEEEAELRRALKDLKRELRHMEDKAKRAGRAVSSGRGRGAVDETSPHGRRASSGMRSSHRRDSAGEIFDKLTNPAHFTGSHKHRFDKHGNGLGLAGRDFVSKGRGTTPSRANAGEIQDISQIMRSAHRGQSVAGVDDHPGFRTPSSPRRRSSPRSPRRNSSDSATSRGYHDARPHERVEEVDDNEWEGRDSRQDDGAWAEPGTGGTRESEDRDNVGYYDDDRREWRAEEEINPRNAHDGLGEEDEHRSDARRRESRGRHNNSGNGTKSGRRGSRTGLAMEPALGYPNQKRSASVGRSTARPSSSTMERSQNSSRNLNVGRGSFASGSWVSAGGGGSPRPDGGKKSATDRYALVGSRAAAELVPADLRLVAFSFAAVSTVRSLIPPLAVFCSAHHAGGYSGP